MFKYFSFIRTLIVLVLLLSTNAAKSQHSQVFPQPLSIELTESNFVHNEKLSLPKGEIFTDIVTVFAPEFKKQFGIDLTTSDQPSIKVEHVKAIYNEAYRLRVKDTGIEVEYFEYEGLVAAFQTMLQLTTNEKIQGVNINDWATFRYRGVHLDCARHFFTIAEIKSLIDEISRLKFNTFHWHLTDDQGWRIEIKKYPKLTSVGGWRDSTLVGHFSAEPDVFEKKRYGGFYTQEEAREIVEYARLRGIDVIPEIELPGHAMAALAAYPELGCTGENLGVSGTWGVFDDVFCTKNETIGFLKDVLGEVIEIFPSKVIHVGGDECPKVRWEKCGKCQAQLKKHNLKNEHELQSFVIGEMSKFLDSKGRTLMGWDEILEGGLVENAQVMSWRGTEGGIAAAKAKHDVVMTPTSHCYFDYYQSGSAGEPLAIGGYLPLEKVYAFNPVPEELTVDERNFILGAQANLWTEYIQDFSGVQYMLFPRLVAMSEVLWTHTDNKKSYNDFVVGLNDYVFPYYDSKGIKYSRAAFEPKVNWDYSELGIKLSIDYPLKEAQVGFQRSRLLEVNETIGLVVSTLYIHPTEKLVIENYDAVVRIDNSVAGQTPIKISSHLALGSQIEFETPPSEKYNFNGDLGLVDGVTGGKPWKGNQWLGFEVSTVKFELTFRSKPFHSKVKFSKIDLGTLHDPGSWIYRPKQVLVEYSTNGKKWNMEEAVLEGDHFILNKKIKAKSIRFTVINDEKIAPGQTGAGFTPWTFLDELIITK